MAFVDPTQPDQTLNQDPSQVDQVLNPNQTQAAQTQADQAPPSTSAGGAGVASAGSGPTSSSSATPEKPSSSGAWTNLDSYLKANSDQAATMGQQIAGNVNAKGAQAQNEIGDLGSNFAAAVDQNTITADPNAVNQAIQDASSLTAGQKLSDTDEAAYNTQARANYSGPTDVTGFNGYSQAQRDVNDATQAAKQTRTEGGRGSLLNDQYQNASKYGYTQGENNLDQLLLENSEGAQGALQPLAKNWSGLAGALNNSVLTGQQKVAQARATDEATAAQASNATATAEKNFEDQLTTGLSNLQQTDNTAYQNILKAIQSGTLSPDDYKSLGLDPSAHVYGGVDDSGNPTGVQLSTYLQQGTAPALANFATADQYAQAAALAQLAGHPESPYLNPASIDQAGAAASAPAYMFNQKQFGSDNASAQAEYNNQVQTMVRSTAASYNNGHGTTYNISNATNDLPGAVQALNTVVAWTQGDPNNPDRLNAISQLNRINAAQAAAGFSPFQIYNGPAVPVLHGIGPGT